MGTSEKEIRELLKFHGNFIRNSRKGHEIWRINGKEAFTLTTGNSIR